MSKSKKSNNIRLRVARTMLKMVKGVGVQSVLPTPVGSQSVKEATKTHLRTRRTNFERPHSYVEIERFDGFRCSWVKISSPTFGYSK